MAIVVDSASPKFRLIWSTLLTLLIAVHAQNRIVINEINADDREKPETHEFVELQVFDENQDMYGWWIMVMQFSTRMKSTIVVTIADLRNVKVPESKLVVFGGLGLDNADIYCNDPNVQFRNHLKTGKFTDFLPNGKQSPIAVLLLHSPDIDLKQWFTLTAQKPEIDVNARIEATIRSHLTDMVVYASKAPFENCKIFGRLAPDLKPKKYFLRDIHGLFDKDLSLSRCTQLTAGYLPEYYRFSNPTPKLENDCTKVQYQFGTNIYELITSLIKAQPNPDDLKDAEQEMDCSGIEPANVYESISVNRASSVIQAAIDHNSEACSQQMPAADQNEQLSYIKVGKQLLIKRGSEQEKLFMEWKSIANFKDIWVQQMDIKYPKLLPVNTISENNDIKSWFNYDDDSGKIRCRICSEYSRLFALNPYDCKKNELCDIDGWTPSNDYNANTRKIASHDQMTTHTTIVSRLIENNVKQSEVIFQGSSREKEIIESDLAATMRMITTVVAEIKAGVSFNMHRVIVELQKRHSVNLGHHHYEIHGAVKITNVIGTVMHAKLLEHIKTTEDPISLIVDSSNDENNIHYLCVLLETIENNRPIVYFYRLLTLTRETGRGMFDVLVDAFEKDGIDSHIKSRLSSFTSDGASSMIGSNTGLVTHVQNYVYNPIMINHCSSHRLDLSLDHAWEDNEFRAFYVSFINEIYTYFYSHSYKRLRALKDTAEEEGLTLYKLQQYFDIRWVESERRCIKVLLLDWPILVKTLKTIIDSPDKEFSKDAKATALKLRTKLMNKHFILILHFIYDILNEFTLVSHQFQVKGQSIIGVDAVINKLVNALEGMKLTTGGYIVKYLTEVDCYNLEVKVSCTLTLYETSNKVSWQGLDLTDDQSINALSTFRDDLLDRTSIEVLDMFPRREDLSVQSFNVFDPELLPTDPEIIYTSGYGRPQIGEIFSYYNWTDQEGMNLNVLIGEFQKLLVDVIKSDQKCKMIVPKKPHIFWYNVLNTPQLFTVSTQLRKLITTVMTIAISSSDTERAFSYMKIVETQHRNVKETTIETLLRIKYNLPDSVSEFDPYPYAYEFCNVRHFMKVDDTAKDNTRREAVPGNDPQYTYMDRSSLF